MNRPIALDLFSGCGGLTLGLKQAGFRVIGAVEVDPTAVKTYRMNHRKTKVWERDIRMLSVSQVRKDLLLKKGELDLLAGCPPCQGFSSMTTLNGKNHVNDERNDLVLEFLRFVKGLRPKAVMLENVPGLAKDERLKILIEKLTELGYQCNSATLDASNYGVPQRRRRFIMLAGQKNRIEFGNAKETKLTVREAFELLIKCPKDDPLQKIAEKHSDAVMSRICSIPSDGGSRKDLDKNLQLDCHKRCDGFKDVYGRMSWDKISPTITGGCFNPSKGRFLHPEENRAITMREAALLQSFPPRYAFSVERGKTHIAQMIGNALPPEFIRMHAVNVREYLIKQKK